MWDSNPFSWETVRCVTVTPHITLRKTKESNLRNPKIGLSCLADNPYKPTLGYLPIVDKKGIEPLTFGCKPSAFPIKLQAHLYRVKDLNLLLLDVSQVFFQLNYHGLCGKSRIRTNTPLRANCFQNSLRYPESFGLSFRCPTGWTRTNFLSRIRRMLRPVKLP